MTMSRCSIRRFVALCVMMMEPLVITNANNNADTCTRNNNNGNDGACTKNDHTDADIVTTTQQTIDCGVYMAPSTIGNHSNLGIFTGKSMKKGDVVSSEILIPFLWRVFGIHPKTGLTDGQLWDRYIWEQYVGEMEPFDDLLPTEEKASCFFPGVGCTVNSMLDLANIKSVRGSEFDEVVERTTSPGSGAFTPYHSARTVVSADQVGPGQELFASYGEEWIPWIPGVAVTKNANFEMADELMHKFEEWIEEHEMFDSSGELTPELLEGMWKFMVEFPLSSRPLSVLPKEWNRDNLKKATTREMEKELGHEQTESPSRQYWANKGVVSLEFLQKNGKCQDHIHPDISTIPDAGRGAFATRDLPKGTIVGYAPLVHIATRGKEILTVTYDGKEHGTEDHAKEPFSRPDLVLNYSFGHRNSTIILTPYGGMVNYINHKSANDGEGPNVRIKWPTEELIAHKPDWLQKDVNFLRDTINKIGLSFDYVALRDIKEGEEVFMDYGDGWVEAWEKHVELWEPPKNEGGYVHSSLFDLEYLRTEKELESNPYPWNLHTLCSDSFKKADRGYTYARSSQTSSEKFRCTVLDRKEVDGNKNSQFVYMVEIEHEGKKIVVHDFPREEKGVELVDKAYSPMWHMRSAFRHKMYIPDDIFPSTWMNLS